MTNIQIPVGAWMIYRRKGRYVCARKMVPIVWTNAIWRIPDNTPVYHVVWRNGQCNLIASEIINSNKLKGTTK